MSMHRRAALISLVVIAAALPRAAGAQAPSLAGTWKLNAEKSKYDPAELGNKSGTTTYAFDGNNVSATIDQVNVKGQKVHVQYKATLDGADHPWIGDDRRQAEPRPGCLELQAAQREYVSRREQAEGQGRLRSITSSSQPMARRAR